MKKVYSLILLVALMTIATVSQLSAQGITSPYSKFGYGLLGDGATGLQRSMGGVGYAMQNGRIVNPMNPASYAATDSLTFLFDMGLDLSQSWSTDGEDSGNSFGGGLDYIAMQFPIAKNMGASIGVIPFSAVGYQYGKDIDNGTDNRVGDGGINQLYAGYAIRPVKGLSVGFNASYVFGTMVNDIYVGNNTSTTLYERIMKVRDWGLQFGAQYTHEFNRRNRATVGVVYSLGKSLHGDTWGSYYDSQDNQLTNTDTISMAGNYEIPATYGAGVSYTYNNRFTAEVNFTYQPWKDAKFTPIPTFDTEGTSLNFNNRWKVAAGLSWQPDPRAGYFKRTVYRVGAYYNNDYMNIKGNDVRDYGVSAGVSLPVPGGKTMVNIGVEYKRRTSSPTVLVKEDYLNITLGVTFNEMWFWQNKIR
ncbi:MAG: OmpP1/FadL family transporter [Muribaculaceae bacterium]